MKKILILLIIPITITIMIFAHVIYTCNNFTENGWGLINSPIILEPNSAAIFTFSPKEAHFYSRGIIKKVYKVKFDFYITNKKNSIQKMEAKLFQVKIYNNDYTFYKNLDVSFKIGEHNEDKFYFDENESISVSILSTTLNKADFQLLMSKNVSIYYASNEIANSVW